MNILIGINNEVLKLRKDYVIYNQVPIFYYKYRAYLFENIGPINISHLFSTDYKVIPFDLCRSISKKMHELK